MSKQKSKLPVFLLICTRCSAQVDGNTRSAAGWTLAPKEAVLCPDCNGVRNAPVVPIRVKGTNKVFMMPVREGKGK